jgi:hypothetical protein
MRSRHLGVLAFIALLAFSAGRLAFCADEREARADDPFRQVTLKIRPLKEHHCRGERVAIECDLVNGSARLTLQFSDLYGPYFDASSPHICLHVNVTRNGKTVPLTDFGKYCQGGSGHTRELPHGGGARWRLTINSVYDMSNIGEYHITASIPVGARELNNGRLIKSAEIKVFVDSDCP